MRKLSVKVEDHLTSLASRVASTKGSNKGHDNGHADNTTKNIGNKEGKQATTTTANAPIKLRIESKGVVKNSSSNKSMFERIGRKATIAGLQILLISVLLLVENALLVALGLDMGYEGTAEFAVVFVGTPLVNLFMAFIEVRLLASNNDKKN